MVGWLVWLVGWLVLLVGWLVWLVGLVGWLVGWLVHLSVINQDEVNSCFFMIVAWFVCLFNVDFCLLIH